MTKTLIIAEKPSVALDISRALGGFTREGDYFESDRYVLASSIGHLLTLVAPNDPVRGKWSFTHLPVIPPKFELGPTDKRSAERLKLLVKLLKRKDVTAVINACDAGREGELIFRYILQYSGVNKPVQRLWLRSMTQAAIREAFENLRDDAAMKPLEAAARSRAEADWLVGINGTRAMTAFNSKDGGFFKTPVGRVQTPTLAIVNEREERIRSFVPRDYWEVHATFVAAGGLYAGRWFDPKFAKDERDPEKRDSRLWSRNAAQTIVTACLGQPGHVTEESKPSTQISPALFDLTSLQREANSRFGFSAKTTLALAQTLYERHKALTYPRTDSRYLPEDYLQTVQHTMEALAEGGSSAAAGVRPFAATICKQKWVKPNRRIFDNKKVSDHFAIIPTLQIPRELSEAEGKIYDLVAKRFLAVFFPAAEFRLTTRITEVSGHHFKTEGKVLVSPGWLAIYGREAQGDDANLVPVAEGEKVKTEDVQVKDLVTKPPARYTEATLLSAMEGAGKLVDDEALREAMSERGLGTPATRAAIIEGLLNEGYLRREGRELVPSAKARQLMTLLSGLGVNELTSPELTGEWEHRLKQIEQRELDRDAFMREIAQMTQVIVKRAKEYERDTVPGDYATLSTPCPKCGGVVKENYRRYACTQCDFSIGKHPGGRTFEIPEVEELLSKRQLGPLPGFISKMGRPFSALLRITDEYKLEFDFGQKEDEDTEPVDFSGHTPVGDCPKCGHKVYEYGMNYVCEKSVGPDKTCDFRSGKMILQQEISAEQARKLLSEGKTDLLDGFVSSRTNRKFKAYLVKQPDGKIGFEFEPRAEKAGTKTAAKTATAAKAASKTAEKAAPKKAATKTATKAAPKKAAVKKAAVKKAPAKKAAGKTAAKKAATATANIDSYDDDPPF
ncbi:DNA topoisomerase III [Parapusillimonas granuli]|uniref:DNA topoisomerase n=1 Tax=Parapusillimonas granuli TaxID=380911 RepID=A0A853FVH8_9BURK|nr:DNA topoisomerase III [Parapusillimonas granuli]MBB5216527.1 DNA topoisomerase-3 [Parapusillimonas granuli]MEB2399730.1 DNA topoisomerase III [Alcaligenaceae bacterium]NYT48167.1 DNA topoisomerase III [Parapusillimonas granuli]